MFSKHEMHEKGKEKRSYQEIEARNEQDPRGLDDLSERRVKGR